MFLLSLTLDAVRGRPAVSAVRCTSCSMRHEAPPSLGGGGAATAEADSRRRRRWEAAAATLEATAEARRRFDHRAHLARLVGVYVGDDVSGALGCDAELLVAVQPDQGGRKLLFLDAADGRTLGFIELETQSAISSSKILEGSAGTASTATAAAATAALRVPRLDVGCQQDRSVAVQHGLLVQPVRQLKLVLRCTSVHVRNRVVSRVWHLRRLGCGRLGWGRGVLRWRRGEGDE